MFQFGWYKEETDQLSRVADMEEADRKAVMHESLHWKVLQKN
jgi:hypothetical protein